MNFTDNRLEREMRRRPRRERPDPPPAPRDPRCARCPYLRDIPCVTCFCALLGKQRRGR